MIFDTFGMLEFIKIVILAPQIWPKLEFTFLNGKNLAKIEILAI